MPAIGGAPAQEFTFGSHQQATSEALHKCVSISNSILERLRGMIPSDKAQLSPPAANPSNARDYAHEHARLIEKLGADLQEISRLLGEQ